MWEVILMQIVLLNRHIVANLTLIKGFSQARDVGFKGWVKSTIVAFITVLENFWLHINIWFLDLFIKIS